MSFFCSTRSNVAGCLSAAVISSMVCAAPSGSGGPPGPGSGPGGAVSLGNCCFTYDDGYVKFDTADVMTTAECADVGGVWTVAGTAPACLTGACCLTVTVGGAESDECHMTTRESCIEIGGNWRGTGKTCEEANCWGGACCYYDSSGAIVCTQVEDVSATYSTYDECYYLYDGLYAGRYTRCEDIYCPEDLENPWGDINHDGSVDVKDVLGLLDSWGNDVPEKADNASRRQERRKDLDRDGRVGLSDLMSVISQWG